MYKAFENKSFESFVNKEYENNRNEIFAVEYEGEKYWVKKGRKTSSNLFHHLCYKLLPFEFLIPVESKTAAQSVAFESNKLIEFKQKGINVPEVIGANENFFVMSDCGLTVYTYLKLADISEDQFYHYLNLYILEVCKIHNMNLYHGGAQSRNFTFNNDVVYAIDLEDSFDKSIDIETLQFRDLLLLLLSMAKVDNFKFSYEKVVYLYIQNSSNENFLKKLKQLSKKLNFLIKLNKVSWIHKNLPRDVKGVCNLLEELQILKSI